MEEKKNNIEGINIKELCELIKKEVHGTTKVKFITNYATIISFACIGHGDVLRGLVEYTIIRNQLYFHQFIPVNASVSSTLIKSFEDVARLYDCEHI